MSWLLEAGTLRDLLVCNVLASDIACTRNHHCLQYMYYCTVSGYLPRYAFSNYSNPGEPVT